MSRSEPLKLSSATSAAAAPGAPSPGGAGAFEAQVIGQPGVRRGLREGETALRRARSAYLSAEWSGADDRRPEPGLLRRTAL